MGIDGPNGNFYIKGNNLINNGRLDHSGYGIFLKNNHNYVIQNAASANAGGNFHADDLNNNYMPTSLTAPDAANANIGW